MMDTPRIAIGLRFSVSAILVLTVACWVAPTLATTYYVKTNGNNSLSGTSLANAWQTIPKACQTVVAGDTVLISPGLYTTPLPGTTAIGDYNYPTILRPTNSGTPTKRIVFKGNGGRPEIQGTYLGDGTQGVVTCNLRGKSWITLDSLHFAVSNMGGVIASGTHLTIANCRIDSVFMPDQVSYDNSAGIITYDEDPTYGDGLIVQGCEISRIGIEVPEGVEGNRGGIKIYDGDTVTIKNNYIWDVCSAGIDIKGSYRNSMVNQVIMIEGNVIKSGIIGIYIGHAGGSGSSAHSDSVVVRGNIIYNLGSRSPYSGQDWWTGIGMNIWGEAGPQTRVWIYNNTIDLNNQGSNKSARGFGPGYHLSNNSNFFNNIIWDHQASTTYKAVHADVNQISMYTDYNIYYGRTAAQALFYYAGSNYTLAQWQANNIGAVTGKDAHSRIVNPMFVDGANHDYRLQAGSPALTGGRGGVFPTYIGALGVSGPPDSSISISDAAGVVEGSNLVFPVTIGTTFGLPCVITYSTVNGTAVAPGDFTASTNSILTIGAGSASGSIIVPTINDSEIEATESMGVLITNVSIGSISISAASASISDNDVAPRTRILFEQLPGRSVAASGTYSGYTTAPIADAVINANGGASTTWASDEDDAVPHWVELVFGQQLSVNGVTVHWAYNSVHSNYTASSQYRIQRWNGSAYVDITTVNNSTQDASTDTSFPPNTTDRIRIYQPAGQGPADYSAIMWLTEVQLWGPQDTTPPAAVTDLR